MGASVMHLFGVVEAAADRTVGPLGRGGHLVRIVSGGGLGIAVREGPDDHVDGLPRERLLPLLLAHQSVLEELMQTASVIPFRFGTRLGDEAEVRAALASGGWMFREALARMGGVVEFEIAVYWPNMDPVFAHIASQPALERLRDDLAAGPASLAQKRHFGEAVKKALDAWRSDLAGQILEALGRAGGEIRVHPVLDDAQIVTASLLVRPEQKGEIAGILEALDARWSDAVAFRLIGPLPPHSFCTLALRRLDPARLPQACQALGLPGHLSFAQVQAAWRRLVTQHGVGPAADDQSAAAWSEVHDARRALEEFCRHVMVDVRQALAGPVFAVEDATVAPAARNGSAPSRCAERVANGAAERLVAMRGRPGGTAARAQGW